MTQEELITKFKDGTLDVSHFGDDITAVLEISEEHQVVVFIVSGDHQAHEVSIDEFISYYYRLY